MRGGRVFESRGSEAERGSSFGEICDYVEHTRPGTAGWSCYVASSPALAGHPSRRLSCLCHESCLNLDKMFGLDQYLAYSTAVMGEREAPRPWQKGSRGAS